MPDRATATTRRTALGVALGALAAGVAACDVEDLDPRSDPTPDGAPTEPPADADALLVEQVVADLVTMLGAPTVATRATDVRRATTSFRELHLAHAEALESPQAEAPTQPGPRMVPRSEALRSLRRRERAHQRRLEEACLAATSGSLARLFASMSAAVAQRLAVLPTERV